MPNEGTVALNNYLQANGLLQHLVSREVSTGPTHAPEWTVTYTLHGEEIGSGTGATKALAKDAAARVALEHLQATAEGGQA